MEKYYYPQKCSYCCSAQSVAIVYNYLNKTNIDEYDIFNMFPQWEKQIKEPITVIRLKEYIDEIFGKSQLVRGSRGLWKNILDGKVIILYIDNLRNPKYGHYTPILNYDIRGYVLIGESIIHEMVWISIWELLPRVKKYIIINS